MLLRKFIASSFIFCYAIAIHGQNVGINVENPTAQFHIQHVADVEQQIWEGFEGDTVPEFFTVSGGLIVETGNQEGSKVLSSNTIDLSHYLEFDISDFVPEGKQAYISYYVSYNLATYDDLFTFGRYIEVGPIQKDWFLVQDTFSSDEHYGMNLLRLSFDPATYFKIDSLSISYDLEENNTFRFDDGFQKSGYLLSTDDNGNAKWINPYYTTATQKPFIVPSGELLLTGKPQDLCDIVNLKNENARLYLDPSRHLRWYNSGVNTTSYSINLGESSTVGNNYAVAFGNSNTAGGIGAGVFGQNNMALGNNSFVIGNHNQANSMSELAIGQYPALQSGSSSGAWQPEDYLVVAGNGTHDTIRENAFSVLKNGSVGIGNVSTYDHQLSVLHGDNEGLKIELDSTGTYWTMTVADDHRLLFGRNGTYYHVMDDNAFYNYSDSRLKSDFKNVHSSLSKLLGINIYHYYMGSDKLRIGVKAQEVKEVFPELVESQIRKKSGDKYFAVNYQGLSMYAIAAMQELAKENEEIKKLNQKYAEQLDALSERLDKLEKKLDNN